MCLSVWAVTFLAFSEGSAAAAVVDVLGEAFLDGVAAERPPVRFGNSGWPGSPCRSASQARRTVMVTVVSGVIRSLRPLPWQETCGPAAEVDVAAGQPGQLGDPQPGLGGEGEHRVVAPPGPGGLVRGGEQGVDLRFGEPGDEGPVEPLGRDGQDPGDRLGVLGVAQGRVGEHGADRGQAGVAGAGAVAAVVLEVVQEAADQRGVQVGDVELAGLLPGALGGERQEQPPGVAVGGDVSGRWRAAAGPAGR